jgi:hypothetical protein
MGQHPMQQQQYLLQFDLCKVAMIRDRIIDKETAIRGIY